eukprot:scaffold18699_cov125-Cylindrotheca_fusiformis.AAC.5
MRATKLQAHTIHEKTPNVEIGVFGPCFPAEYDADLYENSPCAISLLLAGSLHALLNEFAALLAYCGVQEENKSQKSLEKNEFESVDWLCCCPFATWFTTVCLKNPSKSSDPFTAFRTASKISPEDKSFQPYARMMLQVQFRSFLSSLVGCKRCAFVVLLTADEKRPAIRDP